MRPKSWAEIDRDRARYDAIVAWAQRRWIQGNASLTRSSIPLPYSRTLILAAARYMEATCG